MRSSKRFWGHASRVNIGSVWFCAENGVGDFDSFTEPPAHIHELETGFRIIRGDRRT